MSSSSSGFTATETERAWKWLQTRFLQIMTIYVWKSKAEMILSSLKPVDLQLLQNAALESTLMSIRDTDDFFQIARTKPDDLRVGDFGSFPNPTSFLSGEERKIINKCLTHLTTQRILDTGATAVSNSIDGLNVLKKAVAKVEEFCDFLLPQFHSTHPHLSEGVSDTKKLLKKWVGQLEIECKGKFEINAGTLQFTSS